jgi:hypothetical protein
MLVDLHHHAFLIVIGGIIAAIFIPIAVRSYRESGRHAAARPRLWGPGHPGWEAEQDEVRRQRDEMRRQQEAFRLQQDEAARQQREAAARAKPR